MATWIRTHMVAKERPAIPWNQVDFQWFFDWTWDLLNLAGSVSVARQYTCCVAWYANRCSKFLFYQRHSMQRFIDDCAMQLFFVLTCSFSDSDLRTTRSAGAVDGFVVCIYISNHFTWESCTWKLYFWNSVCLLWSFACEAPMCDAPRRGAPKRAI